MKRFSPMFAGGAICTIGLVGFAAVERSGRQKTDAVPEIAAPVLAEGSPLKVHSFMTEGQEGALRINFGDLDLLKLADVPAITPECVNAIPDSITELAGKIVRLRGFMKQKSVATDIPQFLFVRSTDMCCFSPMGRVDHLAEFDPQIGNDDRLHRTEAIRCCGTISKSKGSFPSCIIWMTPSSFIKGNLSCTCNAPGERGTSVPWWARVNLTLCVQVTQAQQVSATSGYARLKFGVWRRKSKMNRIQNTFLSCFALVLVALALLAPMPATACPYCEPTLTLTEQFSKADAAILVQWVSAEMPTKEKLGSTTYEIVQVARAPAKTVEKGKKITLERYRQGKPGDLAVLFGSLFRSDTIDWSSPLEISAAGFKFLIEAPSFDAPQDVRLAYYLKFLENSDPMIAADAFGEFANAAYKDVVSIAKQFPHDSLRKWVKSPKTLPTRINLYGLMLGLCGDDEDAKLMQAKIVEETTDFRLGIDGLMGGYLVLTGEKGLEVLEQAKILNKSTKVPFSETYSAMTALRFMWTYGHGKIPPERLKASMRLLLDRPEISDLVISDLARWKDWSIQEKLRELYGAEAYDSPSIKRSIVRFMISSTKDVPAGGGEAPGKHVAEGARYLDELRKKDPKIVNEAERYFFLQ